MRIPIQNFLAASSPQLVIYKSAQNGPRPSVSYIFLIFKNFKKLEENIQLRNTIKRLEESIDKAAQVISEYSNAYGEQQCSAVDFLQLKHELTKLQTENERLLSKMDQLRHEATQEQRLITQHWYQSVGFLNKRIPPSLTSH